MPVHPNRIQRRADLLASAITDRVNTTYRQLTEPEPAFRVKKPELDQVRDYLNNVQNGSLHAMRMSNGGPYDDKDIDSYVQSMERLIPKYSQDLYNMPPQPPAMDM